MKITDLKNYTVTSNPTAVQPQKPLDTRDFLQKAGDFAKNLPGGRIGEAVGTALVAGQQHLKGNHEIAHNISASGPTAKQVAGSGANAALLFAGGGLGTLGKSASLTQKAANLGKNVGTGGGIGYGMDVASGLEQGQNVSEAVTPGAGTVLGGGLPVAGTIVRPAAAIVGRLFKGLSSGLSGVSADTIERIVNNPSLAQQATTKIAKAGKERVLEENAKTIINGVSKIRQEARTKFGEGLGALKKEDIDPARFRQSIQPILDKFGVSSAGNERSFANIEFGDQKNINRASSLIDDLSSSDLDGLSLRRLINRIENSKYKTATSDERLSFNAFLKDLEGGLKDAVNSSTDKLKGINAAFSSDIQLVETVENIFGKVNFKNLPEVVKASQRLESLFKQKGLAPEVVDNFLKRIGVSPDDFKTTEAVRQIGNVSQQANSQGLNIGEVVRTATSAVVTPDMVKNLSIATGVAKETLLPFLRQMKPAARNVLMQALLGHTDSQTQGVPGQTTPTP